MRLFLAAVLSLSAAAAHANPHGVLYANGQGRLHAASGASNLLYYGGPVIEHAKVYAVFWGDKVDPEITRKIGPFFTNILDSGYMDWLSEYDTNVKAVDGRAGTDQHIGRGRYMGSIKIAPRNAAAALTDDMVRAELEAQIAAGVLPRSDADSLYMIYFPPGVSIGMDSMQSCQTFCAYHEGFNSKSGAPVYYGVMPECDFGCGNGNFGTKTAISAHECIEAVTDPFPTPGDKPAHPQAWNTHDGEEIADLCGGMSKVTGHGTASVVTQLWDNNRSACNPGPWSEHGAAADPLASAPSASGAVSALGWRPSWTAAAAALSR